MKRFYQYFTMLGTFFFLGLMVSAQETNEKVPVVMFDFTGDIQGWVTRNLDAHIAPNGGAWVWSPSGYFALPGGTLRTTPGGDVRNTWTISPVVDLSKVEEAEIFLSYVHRYGTSNNNLFRLHAQEADKIDIELPGDSAFIKQWGNEFSVDLNQETNEGELGIPKAGYDGSKGPYTTSPLNLSMFDGKKIRLGIHFYNLVGGSNASKGVYVKSVQVAGNVIDNDPPVVVVNQIDSIGNTFVRAKVSADEISKVFWAVKIKGQSIDNIGDIKSNIGSSDFIASGITNINAAERNFPFTIGGLEIDTDYTLFYGAEDFKGNISGLKTIDFSTDNDLVAPTISALTVTEVTQISAIVNLLANELGTITYRLYNAGWEPSTDVEFQSGASSVRSGTLRFDTLETAEDWPLEGLTLNSSYIVYATVTDLTGNVSEIYKSEIFTTLADNTPPEITSLVITDITNHGGTMKLKATEPIAGYGDAYAYWIATELGKTVTKEEVLSRSGAYASGSALLDSATYENTIMVENLVKFASYTIHVVVQDGSKNSSEVASYDLTTTDELESVPIFIQEFDVENQNYHFVNVNVHEDRAPVLVSNPALGRVEVSSKHIDSNDAAFWQDAWVIVGPVNLTSVVDASVEFYFRAWYGLYADHVSLWVSKNYKPGDAFNISDWTQFSEAGDFPSSNAEQTIMKNLPAGFDTEGVYIGIRYYHNLWALSYYYNHLKVFGKTIGEGTPPVIDWVEAEAQSATSAHISFTASDYGRMFYYLVKDDGTTPEKPSYQKLIAGDGAAANGFRDYTAGNYIDQNFTIGGLEPNTKYHLFTGFRDLKYNESNEIYYNGEMTVFTTKSLDLIALKDSAVFATNVLAMASGSTLGRVYWTVKGATDDAPESLEEIMSSFTRRGSVAYQLADQSFVNWNITNLKPDSSYVCYAILADPTATYASSILSFAIQTPKIEIRTLTFEDPIAVGDPVTYSIPFNITTSSNGTVYLALTDVTSEQPAVEDLLAGTAGFASASVVIEDINNIVLQLDNLTSDQVAKFYGWAVVASAGYVSEMFMIEKYPTSVQPNPVREAQFHVWSRESSIMVDLKQQSQRAVRVYDLMGRVLSEQMLGEGVHQINSFKPGIYIVVIQQDNNTYSRKIFVK